MSSTFAMYFTASFLKTAGWPQRKGLFGRKWVVSARAADMAKVSLVETTMGLGVGRPDLAVRLIGEGLPEPADFHNYFSRIAMVHEAVEASPDLPPWEAVANFSPAFAERGIEEIEWEYLGTPEAFAMIESLSGWGAFYGLTEAERFIEAFEREADDWDEATAREARSFGLPVPDGPRTLAQFLSECEGFVEEFELARQPLPPAHRELIEHPLVVERLAAPRYWEGSSSSG